MSQQLVNIIQERFEEDDLFGSSVHSIMFRLNPNVSQQPVSGSDSATKNKGISGESLEDSFSLTSSTNISSSMESYYNVGLLKSQGLKPSLEAPPHCFEIADTAYRLMMKQQASTMMRTANTISPFQQYIRITGEGKSPYFRQLTDCYLIFASTSSDNTGSSQTLADQLTHSRVILEAFGHASTPVNSNSARFTQVTVMRFNWRGALVGAHINAFLLERERVVGHCRDIIYETGKEKKGEASPNEKRFFSGVEKKIPQKILRFRVLTYFIS